MKTSVKFFLFVMLITTALSMLIGCATTQGCQYAKCKKYNDKQMRKAIRHRAAVNSIHNPENKEFIEEIAFNEDISSEEVTQEMFNARYGVE